MSTRMVQCPKCRAILQEPPPGNPYYKCGSCFTVLQAKHAQVSGPQRPMGEEITSTPTGGDPRNNPSARRFQSSSGYGNRPGDGESSGEEQLGGAFRRLKTLGNTVSRDDEDQRSHDVDGEDDDPDARAMLRRQRTMPMRLPHTEKKAPLNRSPERSSPAEGVAGSAAGNRRQLQQQQHQMQQASYSDHETGNVRRRPSSIDGFGEYDTGPLTSGGGYHPPPGRQPFPRSRTSASPTDCAGLGPGEQVGRAKSFGNKASVTRQHSAAPLRSGAGAQAGGRAAHILAKHTESPSSGELPVSFGPGSDMPAGGGGGGARPGQTRRSVDEDQAPTNGEEEEDKATASIFRRQSTLPSRMPLSEAQDDDDEDEDEHDDVAPGYQHGYTRQKTMPLPGARTPSIQQQGQPQVQIPTRLQQLLNKQQQPGGGPGDRPAGTPRTPAGAAPATRVLSAKSKQEFQIPSRVQQLLGKPQPGLAQGGADSANQTKPQPNDSITQLPPRLRALLEKKKDGGGATGAVGTRSTANTPRLSPSSTPSHWGAVKDGLPISITPRGPEASGFVRGKGLSPDVSPRGGDRSNLQMEGEELAMAGWKQANGIGRDDGAPPPASHRRYASDDVLANRGAAPTTGASVVTEPQHRRYASGGSIATKDSDRDPANADQSHYSHDGMGRNNEPFAGGASRAAGFDSGQSYDAVHEYGQGGDEHAGEETMSRYSEDTFVEHSDGEDGWEDDMANIRGVPLTRGDGMGSRRESMRGASPSPRAAHAEQRQWEGNMEGLGGGEGERKKTAGGGEGLPRSISPDGRGVPTLPPPDAPQVVQCQHCTQMLAVPPNLPISKKGMQKLRCGKCLQVSSYAKPRSAPSTNDPSDESAPFNPNSQQGREVSPRRNPYIPLSPRGQPPPQHQSRGTRTGGSPVNEGSGDEGPVSGYPRSRQGSTLSASQYDSGDDSMSESASVSRERRAGVGGRMGVGGPGQRMPGSPIGRSRSGRDDFQRRVSVNGQPIPDRVVERAEEKAGPMHPGDFWYDFKAGFWGVMGGPCLGIIPPAIAELSTPMPVDSAGGRTRVFVNGRELHKQDLALLKRRGLPALPGKSYLLDVHGHLTDEETNEELRGLGKLAPSLEERKKGGGMFVPS
eukprot:TRINITY_DN20983_c0_g1_i1.p1 TRINITY_DN20983_c0_g1~~TRINITY_DN20983_c0_g1_i1.p1  ORF type:complete len:1129 (-),score=182.24 TRINITY_DN20983_c0_g1_i1:852-4238(-)